MILCLGLPVAIFLNHRETDYLWLEEKTNSGRKVELKDEREKNLIDLQVKSCLKLVLFIDSTDIQANRFFLNILF